MWLQHVAQIGGNSKSVCHPKFATTNPSKTSNFSRLKIELLRAWKQGTYC